VKRPLAARLLAAPLAAGVIAAALFAWWRVPAPPAPTLSTFLPKGSSVVNQARVELDGRPPLEIAATAYVPPYPGAPASLRRALLAGYDRWRHRWRLMWLAPLPGIPDLPPAVPLAGRREAAVFPSYQDDGRVRYRVIGKRWGRLTVLHEGETAGRIEVSRGVIVERDPRGARGLRWDGRAFRPVSAPVRLPSSVVWRYRMDRNGVVHATTDTLLLVPEQIVLALRSGGGPIVAPIPDPNLDLVETGFRAGRPGVYTITIPDFLGRGRAFRLTLEVIDEPPSG